MSLSLICGKLAFLHDGYIAAIENCCAPIAVKCTLFPTRVASLLLGTLFNTIFAMHVMSYLIMLVVRHLLTIIFTQKSSCIGRSQVEKRVSLFVQA